MLRHWREELQDFALTLLGDLARKEVCGSCGLYVQGLMMDGHRKSVEPMAQRLAAPGERWDPVAQRMRSAVTHSDWDDGVVRQRLAVRMEQELREAEAWVIDDTGNPKKGRWSVGVANQYCGVLGKNANCQVLVSLHLASDERSVPLEMELFLPESWDRDRERRKRAGVPAAVRHRPKWQMALEQIDRVRSWGLSDRIVVADAGYGDTVDFRDGLRERGLSYAVGVKGQAVVWPPGCGPTPPPPYGGRGRPPKQWRHDRGLPVAIEALAQQLPKRQWRTVTWRQGSKGPKRSRFAAVRVRVAHRHTNGRPPRPEEWLVIEWPAREKRPTDYWLSNLPEETSLAEIVRLAKMRWRVEYDYQQIKDELGFDHYEGRTWRGLAHHATLTIAAYDFLVLQHALFPPEEPALAAAASS